VSADELQERFDGIRYNLEDMGYRGFAHVGGGKTGNRAHKVNIYWYPEDDLSVTRSELSRSEEGAEQPAAVSFKRAESSVAPTMTADLAQELPRIAGGAAPAGARGAQPASMARAQKVVDAVRQAWANAPRINVVFDLQDPRVPQEARDTERLQAAEGAEGVPKGFYFDGEVYLAASQLATPEEAARVLYHEAQGHRGLRGAFGEKLDAVLDHIIVARPREVRAKLQEYGERDDLVGRRYAAEEVLAEMAEVFHNIRSTTRAIYEDLRRGRREEGAGTGEWAKLWEQLQLDGGTTGYRDLHADPKDRAKALQKALDQVGEGKVIGSGRALLNWLSDFNETLEVTMNEQHACVAQIVDHASALQPARGHSNGELTWILLLCVLNSGGLEIRAKKSK